MTTYSDQAEAQDPGSKDTIGGGGTNAASERLPIRWSLDDQLEFGGALVSEGLVTAAHLDLAIRHAQSNGSTIGYSLVYIGAITQRRLMRSLAQI